MVGNPRPSFAQQQDPLQPHQGVLVVVPEAVRLLGLGA